MLQSKLPCVDIQGLCYASNVALFSYIHPSNVYQCHQATMFQSCFSCWLSSTVILWFRTLVAQSVWLVFRWAQVPIFTLSKSTEITENSMTCQLMWKKITISCDTIWYWNSFDGSPIWAGIQVWKKAAWNCSLISEFIQYSNVGLVILIRESGKPRRSIS